MGKTFLVTGGAGSLGFAILRMIHEQTPDVTHVKVLDLWIPDELRKVVESTANDGPTFEWIVCDITDRAEVFEAMKGCDVVLHVASVIPGASNDDSDTMWKVNVTGARNVVDACRECGVKGLVYISSVCTVGPNGRRDRAKNLREDSDYDSQSLTFYGETKKIAEDYVLAANGHIGPLETELVTCSLRSTTIYGQSFTSLRYLYDLFSKWKTIPALLPEEEKQSFAYVGNIAVAAITAGEQIGKKAELVGGQTYFIGDNTPPTDSSRLHSDIFAVIGFTPSRGPFPPFIISYAFYCLMYFAYRMSKYLGFSSTVSPSPEYVWRTNTTFTVSSQKFAEHFDFKPKFSPEHAIEKLQQYIRRLAESGFTKPIYDFEY